MIEFFIRQHKAVNLVVILIIVVGVNYFINGQKESFPKIGLDIVVISTVYPGASADEVDVLITKKIEDAINGVDGRKRYYSTSTEGLSVITFEVDTDSGANVADVVQDIKDEIDLIKSDLPSGIKEDPFVREISFGSSQPIIEVVISGSENINQERIKNIINEFRREVRSIEGVGRATRGDYQKTQVWVRVNDETLRDKNIEIEEVANAISLGNVSLPAGQVDLEDGQVLIKTSRTYEDVEQIKNRILRSNDAGQVVRVRDVAEVGIAYEELEDYSRIDGRNAYRVLVYQQDNGDIIDIANGTKGLIEKYREKYSDIKIFYVNDVSFYVERRLRILAQNASIGLILVFLCLILFFDFKVTFWTTVGIPFSFCLAIIVTYSLGITLNLMSMFGFIIVIGLIVDDAIIVSENIYRRRELGEGLLSASINGAKEMFVPILAITATTVVAFLPLSTLPDVFGKVLGILPKVVIITMLASFVECLLVLPGHMANINAKKDRKSKQQTRRWFFKVRNFYGKLITFLLRHPKKSLTVFLFGCIFLAGFMIQRIPFVFFPGAAEVIKINVETKLSNGLPQTEEIIDEMEKKIRENFSGDFRELISTIGVIRNDGGPPKTRTYLGSIAFTIDPDTSKTERELVKELNKELGSFEGVEKLQIRVRRGGPPQGNPVQVDIYGDDLEEIKLAADELEGFIKAITNTRSVQTTYEKGKEEIEVKFDEAKTGVLGINSFNLANVVRTAFEGNLATTINSFPGFKEEVEILVKYNEDKDLKLSDIRNLKIKNNQGERIPLKNFASINFKESVGKVEREDGNAYLSVTGQLEDARSKDYNSSKINALLSTEIIPQMQTKYSDLTFKLGGEQENTSNLQRGAIVAMALSLFGVFFILTCVFKSYTQPFIIMTIVPFSFVGVVIGLFVNSVPLGLMPMLGMVALIGVVVNDSLVLVDFVNRLRAGGMPLMEAVIEGSKSRLRPILMTSITTVLGLMPLAYGIAGKEPFLAPMAMAFMWGLMFSTFVLIFVLPNLYLIFDNVLNFIYTKIFKSEYKIQGRDPIYLNKDQKINA